MSEGLGSADRVRVLEAITDDTLRHLELDEFLRVVLGRVRELFAVDTATVLLHDASAGRLTVEAAVGMEEEVRHRVTVEVGTGFTGTVAATRRPVVLDRVDETTVVSPLLSRKGLRALLGVPMLARDELVGVLHIGSLTPREFDEVEIKSLHLVADRIALATQSELASTDRSAATALQRSLLPTRFPTVEGLRFAARYVPGAHTAVGGDWYDVFSLPGDRVGVVIGDVTGHGLAAAVIMGRLRSALRAYALGEDSPAAVLTRLHQKVSHFEPNAMATVLYGVIDLRAQRMTLSSGGHLRPVIAAPGTPSTLVEMPTDVPVGLDVTGPTARRDTTIDLQPGTVVVLYTDGLVERRDEHIDHRVDQLTDLVTPIPAEEVCVNAMNSLAGDEPARDDIALLVLEVVPEP